MVMAGRPGLVEEPFSPEVATILGGAVFPVDNESSKNGPNVG
jgi:hypothetical protein